MNIEDMTIEQLKALAFDEIVKKEQAQNNLNILQIEIQKRSIADKQKEYEPNAI